MFLTMQLYFLRARAIVRARFSSRTRKLQNIWGWHGLSTALLRVPMVLATGARGAARPLAHAVGVGQKARHSADLTHFTPQSFS